MPASRSSYAGHTPSSRGSRLVKVLIFVVLLLGIVYGALKLGFIGSGPAPAPPARKVAAPTPPPPAPTTWQQRYNATFLYAGQQVTIKVVEVSGLDQPEATIKYTIVALPQIDDKWLFDIHSYRIAFLPDKLGVPTDITKRYYRAKRVVNVSFQWPTVRLIRGSHLIMRIPIKWKKKEPTKYQLIRLALEIPESRQSDRTLEERTGAGGL